VSDIIKIGSSVFVVQSNDIANLKNMPVVNKRSAGNQREEDKAGNDDGEK
jgi:hypothetical protein